MMRVYVHPFYHRMTVNEIPCQMAVYLMWLIVCPGVHLNYPDFLMTFWSLAQPGKSQITQQNGT